jgi:hypothetical protein
LATFRTNEAKTEMRGSSADVRPQDRPQHSPNPETASAVTKTIIISFFMFLSFAYASPQPA